MRRVYVASDGSDSNTGARSSPLLTLAVAISVVDDSGIITCLTDGDFGPVTIDRSVTVDARSGGAIKVTSGNAVNITADSTKVVRLLGLDLVGLGGGSMGVNAAGGATLLIEGGRAHGFSTGSALGINFATPDGVAGRFHARGFEVIGCGNADYNGGILVKPNLSGSAIVTLKDCRFFGNTSGLVADGNGSASTTSGLNVAAIDCLFSGNTIHGIHATSAQTTNAKTTVRAHNCTMFGNGSASGQASIKSDGWQGLFISSGLVTSCNWYGVWQTRAGQWWSYGDNMTADNVMGTDTPVAMKAKA